MTNEEMVAEIQSGKNVKQNMEQLYFNVKRLIYSIAKQYAAYCDTDSCSCGYCCGHGKQRNQSSSKNLGKLHDKKLL